MHPTRIGPYLIERKIGAGGMGNVYLGRHTESGQTAAVKELPAALAREEGFVERFNREIEAMRKLSNPHIVKLYESGVSDGETYYYAMEYVEGETLTARLRRDRRIPWKESIDLAIQICAGLKHAHDNGIIHRDLKPSNLLIDQTGTIKLTDFGVAQIFAAERLTVTGAIIGTAEYMPPEQVEGLRTDRRADLYALGAIIYTMIVGQPPFTGGSSAEIMQKQRYGRFDAPRRIVTEIPSWLDDIVCQLLEKEPEKRLPDAAVVSKRLSEVVKKVELRNSESRDNPATDLPTQADQSPHSDGMLSPTLMKKLVTAELNSLDHETLWDRFFNNTWVLIGMLLVLLMGIVWFWPSYPVPTPTKAPEADRIIQMARLRKKSGDDNGARMLLESLRAVVIGDESQQHVVKKIDQILAQIRDQTPTFQRAFIREAIDRAQRTMEEDESQSVAILNGIIGLYKDDRALKDLVDEARQLVEKTKTSEN